MAEPISMAVGIFELANLAFQASSSLYQDLKSYQSHKKRVHDLIEELAALTGALASLKQLISSPTTPDLTSLALPLRRCHTACKEFRDQLEKCLARSGGNKTSFRDWAKLKYMGEDIDGYRHLIGGYKYTICIVLTDITLRTSTATAESLDIYKDLVSNAQADLEDRLGTIDEKLESLLQHTLGEDNSSRAELELIKEERTSTEQCLELCTELSNHISEIQRASKLTATEDSGSTAKTPPQIVNEGLQECKASLARAAARLGGFEKQLFQRLMDQSATAISSDTDRANLLQLREEWEATRESMDICTRALRHIKEDVSTIENYATGDAFQVMVSTNEKTIHGKNQGLGWRTRQIGGHMNNDSLQQIARMLSDIKVTTTPEESSEQDGEGCTPSDIVETQEPSSFKGKGRRLHPDKQNEREQRHKDDDIEAHFTGRKGVRP